MPGGARREGSDPAGSPAPDRERWIELDGRHLDLRATLAPLGKMVARFTGGGWWKAVRTPEGAATMAVSRPERTRVRFRAWGEGSDWVCDRAEQWLGLGDDPARFVTDHPLVRRLHHLNPGARFGATGLVSEALWAAIFAQKVTGREAARSMRALIRVWGEPAPGPQVGVRLLPRPEKLASAAYYDLHPLGLERRRAEILIRTARRYSRIEKTADLPPGRPAGSLNGSRAWQCGPPPRPWRSATETPTPWRSATTTSRT